MRRTSRALDRFDLDDDRAAARLRRRDGPRETAAAAADAGLPRRVDRVAARSRPWPSKPAPAASSTSSRAASAGTRSRSSARHLRAARASPSGTAACSSRASAGRTTCTCRRSPNFRLPGDIAASKRYYAEDLIDPAIDVQPDGTVLLPEHGPGIGVHIVEDRVCARNAEAPGGQAIVTTLAALHLEPDARRPRSLATLVAMLVCAACAPRPSAPPPEVAPAAPGFEQKMSWILRLEDQRQLRDPANAPPPAGDLVALLNDPEGRIRAPRRAGHRPCAPAGGYRAAGQSAARRRAIPKCGRWPLSAWASSDARRRRASCGTRLLTRRRSCAAEPPKRSASSATPAAPTPIGTMVAASVKRRRHHERFSR